MANLMSVRLNRGDAQSWGFRLQGGKDFGTPLVVQKVTGGSPAERAGLLAGDTVVKINNTDVYNLRHKDAQDVILRAGPSFEIAVQRGGSTWKPAVTPVGSVPSPRTAAPLSNISPVTATSLTAGRQENIGAIGTSHNVSARPFQVNGGPKFVNKQYNSPLPLYSEKSIAETLSAQTEVLSNGVLGVNFKKNEKSYDAEKSAVFRMVQEADKEPRDYEPEPDSGVVTAPLGVAGLKHVHAPETKPAPPTPQLPPGQNICADCERLIVGVFVRIKDKNLHVECFKCSTCGTSLKNVGYYNLNNKLYCDVHAKLAARNNPPAPNLVPVTVPPGGRIPSGTISAALSSHSLPSPAPLSPSTNYSAAPYQPPGASFSSPRPFSSVNAPVSPPSTLPKLSPTPASTTPIAGRYSSIKPGGPSRESRGIQNIVWPPIQTEPELPTASPLYFPPPSQVQIQPKLSTKELKQTEEQEYFELEEMSYLTQHCDRNMSLCSAEISSITGRRSVVECSETISDTIDTQILIESIVQNPPRLKSPPPIRPKSPLPPDVSVTFTISETDLKKGAYATTQAGSAKCETTASSLKESRQQADLKPDIHGSFANYETTQSTEPATSSLKDFRQQVDLKRNVHADSAKYEAVQLTETSSLKDFRQQQSLASMYEKKIKVENSTPHKWESPMVVALTVASDKPYSQMQHSECYSTEQLETTSNDTFSQIPTKRSTSALVNALAVAPSEPFTPVTSTSFEPVPLPKETVPYFPPERPITIEKKLVTETDEKMKSSETTGKKKGFIKKRSNTDDGLFKDLPKPLPDRISMLDALTTAPERSYSPFGIDAPTYKTEYSEEKNPNAQQLATTHVKKDSKTSVTADRLQEKTTKSKLITKDTATQLTSSTQKTCPSYYSAYTSLYQTDAIEKDQSKSVKACSMESLQKKQNLQQTLDVQSSERSKSELVSKNVQSSEDITRISGGTPPYIQMVRSSFETKTDKVQMEMSCQFPGPPVVKKEIIKKTSSTKDSVAEESRRKSVSERKEVSQSSQEIEQSCSRSQRESASMSQAKKAISHESTKAGISESALLQKATLQTRSDTQKQQNVQSISKDAAVERKHLETQYATLKSPSKERIQVVQPGRTNLNVPEISFQPVSDEGPPSTTFSPRPRPLTPSMINKPAPVLPPYQASLAAVQCGPPTINILDPTSPATSRSPSPHPCRRSPSPFPSSAGRPVSPAPGPPPNPMEPHKSAAQLVQENKMRGAKSHLQSYIPQLQSRTGSSNVTAYQTQNVSGESMQSYAESVCTQRNVSGTLSMQRSEQQKDLLEKANLETQSAEAIKDGTMQIQRKKKVTEEYEHTQKSKVIQIEKMSTDSQFRTSQTQATTSFHVTNPQPIKSLFISHDEISDKKENVLQSDSSKKASLTSGIPKLTKTTPNISSGSHPTASTSSTVNVNKPNVSQPNAGTGGRQAGAIGVAPRRGRGILNLAASPGSRVPLCASCHSNIRGPFITALGKIWCPDHFICATPSCRRALHDLGFVEERGQLYCEYCFEQYIAPPCSKCGAKVKGDCLKAIGKNFHPECFNCVYCGKLFGNSPFFLEDAQPYCEADWNELFTTKCFACGFPVEAGDRWVEALNNNYHSQCFNCTMCKKNLEGQSFFAKGGRPFCKNHAR